MVYEDAAAIFYGPIHMLFKEGHHYGPSAKNLFLVAALQRLANGIGVRLLADLEFRNYYAGKEHAFENPRRLDVFVFRVTVANDEYEQHSDCLRL